jgi:phosphotransferase system enzyme I (PtsI)
MSESESRTQERRLYGIGVCPGIVQGEVFAYDPEESEPPSHPITEEQIGSEISRLEAALLETRGQILEMQKQIASDIGSKDAAIFDAHLLVVDDTTIYSEVVRKLEEDLLNVERVYFEVTDRYAKSLAQIDDPYLRERAHDLHDVTRRVLRNLSGKSDYGISGLASPHIVVARDLTPSETAGIDRTMVLGFATDGGSSTSHTAIMARSLNIPAVVGLRHAMKTLKTGDEVLLDGFNGLLIINPEPKTLQRYGEMQRREGELARELGQLRETDSTTRDGRKIILSANIERKQDAEMARDYGANGVGLYRTEFLFLNRQNLPDEEEQYQDYLNVATTVQPNGVIIRTLDVGGDKVERGAPKEPNPFLGWRAIRFCLERPDIFKIQLRAILRAGSNGNVRLMYPMVACLEELQRANELLEECRQELRREGVEFNENMEVGMMVELPSAALAADVFAKHVDFFSIGTNDLIQYTIGVDRLNERVAGLYRPTHPSVIKLMHMAVEAAHQHNIWIGICGETAGDLALTPLMVGLDIDELSVGSSLVPRVKKAIQNLDHQECRAMLQEILTMTSTTSILQRTRKMAQENYPGLLG